MSGEEQIVQPVQPVELPVNEKKYVTEQNTTAINAVKVQASSKISKFEDRFNRLKRNLRKRSAGIL